MIIRRSNRCRCVKKSNRARLGVFEYEPKNKHQCCQYKSKVNVILIKFFGEKEHCPQWVFATGPEDLVAYPSLSVREELWQDKSWLHHHDNAPAYNTQSIWQLAEINTTLLEQPARLCSFPQAQQDRFEGVEWRCYGESQKNSSSSA